MRKTHFDEKVNELHTSCEVGWSVGVEDNTQVHCLQFLMRASQAFPSHPEFVFNFIPLSPHLSHFYSFTTLG